jgi:hypothetical protein
MGQPVDILLLDDGELDDVQQIFEELGLSFGRVRGGAIVDDTPPPTSLLVSTPRRISAIREPEPYARGRQPVRIIVVNEDSTTLRTQLRELGFDYLVRRPVHPEALRLLLLRCLYTGEERRKEPRVSVGYEISFRSGLLRRRSTLVELSVAGCRLLSRHALEPGRRIKVEVPQALGAAEPLSLRGRILRTTFDERLGSEGLHVSAVEFEQLSDDARQELEWVLEKQAQGPPTLGRGLASAEDGQPGAAEPKPLETDAATHRSGGPLAEPTAPAAGSIHRLPVSPPAQGPGFRPPAIAGAEAPPLAEPRDPGLLDLEVEVRMGWGAEESERALQETARSPSGRRSQPRGSYDRKIPAFGERALRVLVGRDLSVGGMRVERIPDLEIGDRLHLAIYGAAGEEPSLVWATVARNDAGGTTALVFDPLEPGVGERLERLVADLPAVESLHDEESEAMGTVVSEILEA